MKNNEQILKEYIRSVIAEDGDGGGGGDGGGLAGLSYGGSGSGGIGKYGFGNKSHAIRLLKIFTDPFKILSSELQQIGANAKMLVGVFFESIMTTVIPFLESDYDKIFEQRDKSVKDIQSKYGDVYKEMWESFKQEDLLVLSFMMDPGLFMAGRAFWKTPEKAAAATKFISGGIGGNIIAAVTTAGHDVAAFIAGGKSSIAKSYKRFESVERLHEDSKEGDNSAVENYAALIKKFRYSDEYDEMLESEHAREVSHDAQDVIKESLRQVIQNAAEQKNKIKTLEDLKGLLGNDAKEVSEQLEQLDDADKASFEQQLVESTQKSITTFFAEKLKEELARIKESGLPSGTKLESMYRLAIQKLS